MFRLPKIVQMDAILQHSFKDFHAKGMDYICLRRSEQLTIKLYLMDGVVSTAAEVVNPHDHRYIFASRVLSGRMTNHKFKAIDADNEKIGRIYETFNYMTPLNGGDGFTHIGETRLHNFASDHYRAREAYYMWPGDLHTIQVYGEQTALLLYQFADRLPLDKPTLTYSLNKAPPSLDGLYSRFKPDEIIDRLAKLHRISGIEIGVE